MMNRRRFLASLGALAVVGKAAPGILAKINPAPTLGYNDCPLGLGEAIGSETLHGLSGSTLREWGVVTAVDQRAGTITVDWSRA
jgi:hypothetical protein